MRYIFSIIFLWSLLLLTCCSNDDEGAPADPDPTKAYDFSAVKNLLDDSLNLFNGNVYVAFIRDGEEIFSYQAGNIQANTIRPLASATKWISGAVILTLYDDGLLDLDKRIGDYLPIFDEYDKGDFTIRQCFAFTTGIDDCLFVLDPECPNGMPDITLEEGVNMSAMNLNKYAEPGQIYRYGGNTMNIAARAAEVVTEQSWKDIMQERITGPLGMSSTLFGNTENPMVGGGLASTANDYLKFLAMIEAALAGESDILSKEAAELFFTDLTENAAIGFTPYPTPPPFHPYDAEVVRYGFGTWQDVAQPGSLLAEQVSSAGAFGTFPWVDRKRGLRGIIFTFSNYENLAPTLLKASSLVRGAVDEYDGS